jgi:deoxyribose-phosphate aldolase
MTSRDIDDLVHNIAARVRDRLQESARSGVSNTEPCTRTKEECVGCGWGASRRPADVRAILRNGASRVAASPDVGPVADDLASAIDHTLLKPDVTKEQLDILCAEARKYSFASVCVNPSNVRYCSALLQGCSVRVCTVVGFPLGATTPGAKAYEAREAVRAGATEIDMVMNVGALKSGDYALVLDDIRKVVDASAPHTVKVILETGGLDEREKVIGCTLSKVAGAHFVKTSTGFGPGGATVDDVRLMKAVVGDELEVKASGGVRSTEQAREMLEAGATRIGASASVAIVTGKSSGDSKGY